MIYQESEILNRYLLSTRILFILYRVARNLKIRGSVIFHSLSFLSYTNHFVYDRDYKDSTSLSINSITDIETN